MADGDGNGSSAQGRPAAGPGSGEPTSGPEADRGVGELVLDVSERVSILVREEIELAKAEVSEKASELARGAAVAGAAGIFVVFALNMLMFTGAWLLNDILGIESAIWVGFLLMAVIFLICAAGAGFAAYRAVQKGSPPSPEMAIEEAKLTKETLGGQR